jgi:hypothetical protein
LVTPLDWEGDVPLVDDDWGGTEALGSRELRLGVRGGGWESGELGLGFDGLEFEEPGLGVGFGGLESGGPEPWVGFDGLASREPRLRAGSEDLEFGEPRLGVGIDKSGTRLREGLRKLVSPLPKLGAAGVLPPPFPPFAGGFPLPGSGLGAGAG